MNQTLGDLIRHALFLFVGVLIAAFIVPGLQYESMGDLIWAAVVLALLNALLKPLLILFMLPFIILTLGLGLVLVNAVLLYLAGVVVPGFVVASFWSGIFGAVIISVIHGLVMVLFMPRKSWVRQTWVQIRTGGGAAPRKRDKPSDVIDV